MQKKKKAYKPEGSQLKWYHPLVGDKQRNRKWETGNFGRRLKKKNIKIK